MKTIKTVLATEASFSDDGLRRYLLRKTWDEAKPKLAIIMLAPSEASGIELDTTTQLVLNNATRLGYGSVSITNLFSALDDHALKHGGEEDPENLKVIIQEAERADLVVYAPGVGKARSKVFLHRQEEALRALTPFEGKLHCLCDGDGKARLQHPLSPAVRTWYLSPLKVKELAQEPKKIAIPQKKKEPAKGSKNEQENPK